MSSLGHGYWFLASMILKFLHVDVSLISSTVLTGHSISRRHVMNSIVYIFRHYCASISCNKIYFVSIVSARVESIGS